MELVFIHGWGFDASVWDPLFELLPQFKKRKIDLGFFGATTDPLALDGPSVLVGHSLGFLHGLNVYQGWHRWIAINGFARFVRSDLHPGCVLGPELREMRIAVGSDPHLALSHFYERIAIRPPELGRPDKERLRAGLDELRDGDLRSVLEGLDVPGLVLAARHDPLVPPKVSENLCGLTREGAISWHEEGGHALHATDPVWCAQAIEDFLR